MNRYVKHKKITYDDIWYVVDLLDLYDPLSSKIIGSIWFHRYVDETDNLILKNARVHGNILKFIASLSEVERNGFLEWLLNKNKEKLPKQKRQNTYVGLCKLLDIVS